MNIAVLSGKGGTGKTLVSVNLAAVAKKATYIDCDVEEPNGHIFFKPKEIKARTVSIKIPVVDEKDCKGCRKCVDFCNFNALAYTNKLKIFEEICHSCGGCKLVCAENAIKEKDKKIGEIQIGTSDQVEVITGVLDTGEASGVPIINELIKHTSLREEINIIDCPPGSACIVMESIKDADYCVLVTEPTVFGVHNMKMVYELIKLFNKPHGAVINKYISEEINLAELFCLDNDINILQRIPFDYELGKLNSNGKIVSKEFQEYKNLFSSLLEKITKEVLYAT
ncbi:MAG: AAA family ATPase [Eubacteriales bacterium]